MAAAGAENGEPLALPNTDWVRNRLTISGPADAVRAFGAAAHGTGGVPWQLDLDAEAARLLAPMEAAGPAARQLACALRETIATRHDRVLAGWAQPGACPLDLHRLIPVPPAILQLGEDHPAARRWLWAHWGTTRPLHQVQLRAANADRRLRRSARMTIDFLSADWTPWPAIVRLRRDFPILVFAITPGYADG